MGESVAAQGFKWEGVAQSFPTSGLRLKSCGSNMLGNLLCSLTLFLLPSGFCIHHKNFWVLITVLDSPDGNEIASFYIFQETILSVLFRPCQ